MVAALQSVVPRTPHSSYKVNKEASEVDKSSYGIAFPVKDECFSVAARGGSGPLSHVGSLKHMAQLLTAGALQPHLTGMFQEVGTICSIYSLLEFMMGAPVDVRRFKQCSAAECAKQVYAVTKQLTDGGKLHPLDSAGRSKVELLFSTEIDSADDSRLNTRAFLSRLEEVDKIAAAVMGSEHESDLAERRARYSRMLASTDDGCFSIPEIEVAERQLRHLSRGAFDHGLATMQIGPASDMVTAMTQMKRHFSNGPLRIYNWGTISRDAFETYVERPAEMASAQADAELRAEKLAHIRSQRAGAAAKSKSKGPRRTSLSGSRVGGEDPSAEPDSDEGSEDEAPPAAAGGGGRGKRGRVGSDPTRRDDPARKGSASLPARGNFCTFLERGNNGYD